MRSQRRLPVRIWIAQVHQKSSYPSWGVAAFFMLWNENPGSTYSALLRSSLCRVRACEPSESLSYRRHHIAANGMSFAAMFFCILLCPLLLLFLYY